MTEPTASSAGAAWLIKVYGIKVIAAVIAVAISFAFLWPKTAKEGVVRIGCTMAGSMLFGEALQAFVHAHLAWWPRTHESSMIIFVAAGLPAWWLLGAIFRWLDKRRDKDIGELYQDAKKDATS
jgi:hypothetical protein